MTDESELATTAEVAAFLRISPRTLDSWAAKGKGPKFTKVGRLRRYDWADVRRYLNGGSSEGDL